MGFERALSVEAFAAKNHQTIVALSGRQIALVRGPGGEVFALDNRCPHEGYPLSQGTVNGNNVLTCQWHNWKFSLATGDCLIGGDNVRVYPVKVQDGYVWVDPSGPPIEVVTQTLLNGLQTAVEKRQYGRIARELARFSFSGISLDIPVNWVVQWSHDRFEYGMTHAYAALADWLRLAEQLKGDQENHLICLTEAIDHIALDALRRPQYPFTARKQPYTTNAFLEAVESENEEHAVAVLNGAFEGGVSIEILRRDFATAALQHYNDFGHTLIYVFKAFSLEGHVAPVVHQGVLKSMARSLCYTTREDLLPEFQAYRERVDSLQGRETGPGLPGELAPPTGKMGATAAMRWLVEAWEQATPAGLFDALLEGNARNWLNYTMAMQFRTDNTVAENVGWLDFTHAVTFSNAVRNLCTDFPALWPAGLLQMACFYGRNARHTAELEDAQRWAVDSVDGFFRDCKMGLLDHGQALPIYSAHLLKTTTAVEMEVPVASDRCASVLVMALNRFMNSPIRQKHVRRMVQQGIRLVARDYGPMDAESGRDNLGG